MTFKDIFKNGFLESIKSFSLGDTLLLLILAFILGIIIVWVYREATSEVIFSNSFSVSLIGLCMITTFVILAVTSNVVLSLGMVGALSIVRFRTAIKEPLDIVFLFWSISIGIVLGAGLIPLAYIGSLLIAIILLVFSNKKVFDTPYILIINCNEEGEESSLKIVKDKVKKYKIKSKSITKENIELMLELRLHDMDSEFINKISKIDGVSNVLLVGYNGEYSG